MVLIALTLFALGAIIAAVSNNFTVMLVGRSIQGVGGGGMISLTEVVITDMVPLRERGKWLGYDFSLALKDHADLLCSVVNGMYAIGSVTGPIVGGAFAQKGMLRLFRLTLNY